MPGRDWSMLSAPESIRVPASKEIWMGDIVSLRAIPGARSTSPLGFFTHHSPLTTHHYLIGIGLESERLAADDLVARDRRGHELLDVLDDQLGALVVIDVGPILRVVHRVGHVAHEDDVLAVLGQLTQAERSAEDAHVGVHAEDDH